MGSEEKKVEPVPAATTPESDEGAKLNQERLDRCIPIAKAINKVLQESDAFIGDISPEERLAKYKEIAGNVIEIMRLAEVRYVDMNFIFQLAAQPVDSTKDLVTTSVIHSFNMAEQKLMKKDYMDLTLQDLDDILKAA